MKGQIQSSVRRSLVQTARLGLLFLVPVGLYACLTPYGPDTCMTGFVWREAAPVDHVCVSPQTRQQTLDENARADARRVLPP